MSAFSDFFGDGRFSEYVIANVIKSYMTSDDILFDGGANEGFHTIRALATGAQIYAFEPIPEVASKLKQEVSKFAQLVDQCRVIEAALSKEPGTAEFSYCPARSTLSGLMARDRLKEFETKKITVEVTSIDQFVQSRLIKAPTVIKLDLEGGEFNAMLGARHVLSSSPILLFEHGGMEGAKLYGYTYDEYWEYLRNFSYTILHINGRECTLEEFKKPKHWNYLALNLSLVRHKELLDRFDYLTADAAQKMALLHGIHTSV